MAPSGWLQDRSDRARGPPRTIDLAEGMRGSADGVAWYSGGRRIRSTATATPMLYPRRRRHRPPKPDRRRALELLAASPDGCTEALMLANGFTVEMLVELIRTELATAQPERMIADGKQIEVARCGSLRRDGRRLRERISLRAVAVKLIAPFHHMAAAGPLIAVSSHPYRRLQSNCRLPCSLRANAGKRFSESRRPYACVGSGRSVPVASLFATGRPWNRRHRRAAVTGLGSQSTALRRRPHGIRAYASFAARG
jgi:hypothetical protein